MNKQIWILAALNHINLKHKTVHDINKYLAYKFNGTMEYGTMGPYDHRKPGLWDHGAMF